MIQRNMRSWEIVILKNLRKEMGEKKAPYMSSQNIESQLSMIGL